MAASSSAAPELTHPTGTRLANGALFSGTTIAYSLTKDGGTGSTLIQCASTLTGQVTKNSGSEIEANITSLSSFGTGGGGWCTTSFGNVKPTVAVPLCLKATAAMATDEFQIRGGKCSESSKEVHFTIDGPGCEYGRTEPLKGTFLTDKSGATTDAVLTLSEQGFIRKTGVSILCPNEYKWEIIYTLETDKEISEPLYFS
jgi:hypothetical protein